MNIYSPNLVPKKWKLNLNYDHRSSQFQQHLYSISSFFRNQYGYKCLIIQGSGTTAIESVINCLNIPNNELVPRVLILNTGIFSYRSSQIFDKYDFISSVYSKEEQIRSQIELQGTGKYNYFFATQFETSNSGYNKLNPVLNDCKRYEILSIVDCISSFPYYDLPDADICILSSSKQIGAIPVLGIILYKPDLVFRSQKESLNLYKYEKYIQGFETPHTAMLPQVISLDQQLKVKYLLETNTQIELNCYELTYNIEHIIENELVAPVITLNIPNALLPNLKRILEKKGHRLYHNSIYMENKIQVGMFCYKDSSKYKSLNKILRRFVNENSL